MASLGTLSASIGLDTAGLRQGQRKAEQSLGALGKRMRSGINTAGKYGAAMAAAGAAISAHLFKNAVDGAREIQNLANVSDASVEAFQRQAYAARTVGVEQDKYADILKDMKDRVGDFITAGAGPMVDFFENVGPKVGVTAEEFRKLSGPDALQLYVDSLEKANLSQAEMTFYMEALAGDSTKLLPLLRDSGKGMRTLGDEADRTGNVLSEIDIASMSEAERAIEQASQSIEGLVNKAAVKVAPVMQAISESIATSAADTEGLGSIIDRVFNGIVTGAGLAGDGFRGIQIILKTLQVAAQGLGTAMTSTLTLVLEGLSQLVAGAMDGLTALIQTVNRIPGVNIPTEGLTLFRENVGLTIETMRGMRESAHIALVQTTNELNELAMAPLPSRAIDNYLQEATVKSRQAAQEVVSARTDRNQRIATLDEEEAARTDDFNKEALERLREQLKTEQEIADEKYTQRMETLDDALKNEAITQDEYARLKEKLEQEHMDNMAQIRGEGMREMENESRASLQQQTQDMQGAFGEMFGAFTQHSETMNKANKIYGQAQAFISTVTGAAEALKLGWPQGPIAAASIMAQGMALVSQIKSASTRGSSGGSSSSASSGHRQSPMAVGQEEGQRSGSIDIDVMGGRTSEREFARSVLNEANNLMGDGYELRVRGGG